jgi:hypothetical protein
MARNPAAGALVTVARVLGADSRGHAEPITFGLPFPRQLVRDVGDIGLVDDDGAAVPVQALATDRWPDGSVRWALLDFQERGVEPRRSGRYRVTVDGRAAPPGSARVEIVEDRDSVVVNTGAARFEMRPGERVPFAAVSIGGESGLPGATATLVVTDSSGRTCTAAITEVDVETRGNLRSAVRLRGTVGSTKRSRLDVIARVEFFAGSAATRIAITLRNPQRARHRGGHWELGDPGSVFFQDASLHLALPAPATRVECSVEPAAPLAPLSPPVELYQDSSGAAEWRQATHVNRHGVVPCTFRGYRLRHADTVLEGLRATPAISAVHALGSVTLAVEHFWQNFPKAIEVDGGDLRLRLWPQQFGDLHELQGGEQKTHRFTLAFGDDPMARDAVHWGRQPSAVAAAPEWYAATGAIPYLSPATDDADPRYRQLVNLAVNGNHSFARKRDIIDEHGWRNFGDIYADHENPFAAAPGPIVSHYNNQYDAIGGCAVQFMRTADPQWWRLMSELAVHVTDIDIYHTDRDKAAYNHGLFWHTYHYVDAGTSSHRSYPNRPGVSGGGPANEHNYAGGLRLHWLLTGDPLSREAAIGLATWVLNMDDGRKTVLRWLSRSDTGLASATQSPDFHGPGRGAGHSILALIEGHRLTADRQFLAKAEQVIRRCIHPADDIDSLTLLDAERRWSYVVFLQALGKFLDYKSELAENDLAYAYGREALLHYARWMTRHEYPYLDKPQILEYPTETWAAQDMRKCEVFSFAAQHAAGAEQARFVERAEFFFDYSLSALLDSPTRAFARPLVLLLSNGFMRAARRPVVQRPKPHATLPEQFGKPSVFVPQKTVAKGRLKMGAAAFAVLALAALIASFGAVIK